MICSPVQNLVPSQLILNSNTSRKYSFWEWDGKGLFVVSWMETHFPSGSGPATPVASFEMRNFAGNTNEIYQAMDGDGPVSQL